MDDKDFKTYLEQGFDATPPPAADEWAALQRRLRAESSVPLGNRSAWWPAVFWCATSVACLLIAVLYQQPLDDSGAATAQISATRALGADEDLDRDYDRSLTGLASLADASVRH